MLTYLMSPNVQNFFYRFEKIEPVSNFSPNKFFFTERGPNWRMLALHEVFENQALTRGFFFFFFLFFFFYCTCIERESCLNQLKALKKHVISIGFLGSSLTPRSVREPRSDAAKCPLCSHLSKDSGT